MQRQWEEAAARPYDDGMATRPSGAAPDREIGVPIESQLPSVTARALAFGAIVVAGVCGGLIGYAVTDLSCVDGCGAGPAIGALVGAAIAAIGVAVVAVLALRAMGEWKTIQQRDAARADAGDNATPSPPGSGGLGTC